jgi:hypothetical protein
VSVFLCPQVIEELAHHTGRFSTLASSTPLNRFFTHAPFVAAGRRISGKTHGPDGEHACTRENRSVVVPLLFDSQNSGFTRIVLIPSPGGATMTGET